MKYVTRVPRSKQAARKTYDRLSRWYDMIAGPSETPHRHLGLQLLDLQPGERALDIGFGTGSALVAIARSVGVAGHSFGLDLSPGMVRVARDRFVDAGMRAPVSLCVGDGAHPPFAAHSFDAVFISFSLELFDTPELPVVLEACRMLLRPSGRLCVVALSRSRRTPAVGIYEWFHRQFPRWIDCRPIHLQALLREAEYRIVEARSRRMWGLPVDIVLAKPHP